MKLQDLYDRIGALDGFEGFSQAKPMAIADAFEALASAETLTDDEAALAYDLALGLSAWGFRGLQGKAIAWLSSHDAPPVAKNDADQLIEP
tara:strand:+ start:140 stop:412 length:273 start_codon:yes stop_codon:yes gene_type:complete